VRWAIFAGIALPALGVIAVAVSRVIQVVSVFSDSSAAEPQSVAPAATYVDDPVTRSPSSPPVIVNPAAEEVFGKTTTGGTTQALSEDLDDALRAARASGTQEKRQVPPKTGPRQNLRPVMARTKLDSADLGEQVEGLSQKVAPALAREVLEHSADNAARSPEVEHELLETWKEQKQILAGQRPTVDSVLKDTP
jgi:hypothetical protein